jgi:glycosyltransferase involved in cell wall biosynthesis
VRILSLTYEYPPIGGGGGRVAAALNEELARSGDQVEVLTSRMKGFESRERIGRVTVHRSACMRRDAHYTTALELATTLLPAWKEGCRLIETYRPNLLHTHFVLPSGVIAWRLARRYQVPYVITAHGSDIPEYNPDRFALLHKLLKPFWRQVVANASLLISPSEFLAGLIRRQVDLPIRVIPNGYSPAASLGKPKRNLVLVVARLFPRKGVQRFIEAIPGMPRDWEYVIAGDGPYLPKLKDLAERLRVPVRFVGFVDAHTLRGYYEEARILVFPSIRENFPMVLLEAMDAGCAVITTDAEGCGEVVGKAGLVVRKNDAQQIRVALSRLMADPARCEQLGVQARARADQFRWPRIAGLYRDAFSSAFVSAPLTDTAIQRRLVV